MFEGPLIFKGAPGLGGQAGSTDKVFGMIAGGVAASGLALNTVKKLIQVKDAEDVGIDAAYDAANDILVYNEIVEFFNLCPDGVLYIMLVAQSATMAQMCDIAQANSIKKLVLESEDRALKYVGIKRNPDMATYNPTLSGGLDEDVLNAIPKAQQTINTLLTDNKIYLDGVVIEGREVNGTLSTITDLHTLNAPGVSVSIAQDPAIAGLDPAYADTAAIGAVLGALAIRKVCENLGSVDIANKPLPKRADENYSITDAASGRWQAASLSSGATFDSLTPAEKVLLTERGYIYAGKYEGYPGHYFNQGHTAGDPEGDFNRIERNRTWNKAARILRRALLPKTNGNVFIDTATGFIASTTVAEWQALANKRLEVMKVDEEVSDLQVKINPRQNTFAGPLKVKLRVVPRGVAEAIEAEVEFTLTLNS